jgi:hypothetical protein
MTGRQERAATGEPSVLKIDLASLSERELEDAVVKYCSSCGNVRKLRFYPAAGTLARPFALVDMETAEQAERLAAAFGRLAMGNAVVIVLQQGQAAAPTLPPTSGGRPAMDNTLSPIMEELRRQ